MFEYTVKKHPRFLKKIIIIFVSLGVYRLARKNQMKTVDCVG